MIKDYKLFLKSKIFFLWKKAKTLLVCGLSCFFILAVTLFRFVSTKGGAAYECLLTFCETSVQYGGLFDFIIYFIGDMYERQKIKS